MTTTWKLKPSSKMKVIPIKATKYHMSYSEITLERASLKEAIFSPMINLWLFWPCSWFHIPLGYYPYVKWIFKDFSRKNYEWEMRNPWKNFHPLFWVHRVYGIQNDRLYLMINEFLTVWKTCIVARDIYKLVKWKNLKISLATMHCFSNH